MVVQHECFSCRTPKKRATDGLERGGGGREGGRKRTWMKVDSLLNGKMA